MKKKETRQHPVKRPINCHMIIKTMPSNLHQKKKGKNDANTAAIAQDGTPVRNLRSNPKNC